MTIEYTVFCGLDVGKEAHHACALDTSGRRLFDAALPQDEARLRELFARLAEHGPVLVVVDQPNTIGALPIAVARAMGLGVAYLPGLAMRRIADLHPGTAKTDARDAYVIADAARVMPHTLRRVDVGEEALAELNVLVGFDDDLAAEATRLTNRLRGLLTQVHPALERVLGPRIHTKAVMALVGRYGGPAGLRKAGRGRLLVTARKANPRGAAELVDHLLAALDEQTVIVPGTSAAETVLPTLATSLSQTLDQRAIIAAQVEQVLDAHPLAAVLTSMPGVGVRTAARILLEVGDASSHRRPPRRLRRTCPGHPPVRHLHPRRAPTAQRQQAAQAGPVPLRLRVPSLRRGEPGLLRPQTRRRQATQRRPHLPRPPTHRRPLRHDQTKTSYQTRQAEAA